MKSVIIGLVLMCVVATVIWKMNRRGASLPPASSTVAHTAATFSLRDYRARFHEQPFLTKYDLMTEWDALYLRYLSPQLEGAGIKDWPVIKQALDLGVNLGDASIIADRLYTAFPVYGQNEAFADLQEIVAECAQKLDIVEPRLLIESKAGLNAYVTGVKPPYMLVIGADLREKYKKFPNEMRFIIGHELGHLKCNHVRAHLASDWLVAGIIGVREEERNLKENLVAGLLVGQLLRWHRESEFSADRAGLLCCGDLKVAQQALLRLMHGTDEPNVDPKRAAIEYINLENEPFVKVIRHIKSFGTTHPWVPERCLALEQWSYTSQFTSVRKRLDNVLKDSPDARPVISGTLVVDRIEIQKLPETDGNGVDGVAVFGKYKKCDPTVIAISGDEQHKSPTYENVSDVNIDLAQSPWRFPYTENATLFIELEDYDRLTTNEFVGSCVMPIATESTHAETNLRLDIKSRSSVAELPIVSVAYHVEGGKKN